ncbi:hypothetical protein FACS189421_05780 [Bacteroidia bacterium]|nr:hypothetical protein FACS189421_05780 [Bacteroidia bacterium]GHT02683.1 hypothetical protein FACS189423_01890 [Bacteroidia bacterium]GHT45769.1 hypothetical protein FACS189440_02420 [Bacteroidia bacterium]
MKKSIIIGLIGLYSVAMYGQESLNKHEISVWGAGGLTTLLSNPVVGSNIAGLGGQVGLGYNYSFNPHWSLGAGVEYFILNGGTKMSLFTDTYLTPSETGEYIYRIQTEGNGVKQKYSAAYFNIPVSVKYQTDPNAKGRRWYVAGGAKLGIPTSGSYKTDGTMTTKGWEIDANGNPHSSDPYINMPHHGFGTYELSNVKQDFKFEMNLAAFLETGIKWRLSSSDRTFLYTGLFVDYGLLDVHKGGGENRFYQYNPQEPSRYIESSIFTSKYNNGTQPYVDKINTLAAGIKVALAFSVGGHKNGSNASNGQVNAQPVQPGNVWSIRPDNILTEHPDYVSTVPLLERQAALMGRLDAIEAEHEIYLAAAEERRRQYEEALLAAEDERQQQYMELLQSSQGIELDNYDLARVTLTPEQKLALEQYVDLMKRDPDCSLYITGHTCNLGSEQLNMRIGQERADLAKDFLVENGIAPSRIHTFSKGELNPLYPNDNEVDRRKNRRLELTIRE